MTDEKASQVLHKLQKVINGNTANNQGEKANATARLQEVITDAQYSLDLGFAAGTLATTAGIARPDAVQHAERLQDGVYKEAVEDAKRWLKSTVKKVGEIELNGHEFMKYWLGEDARVLQNTKEFIKQAKKEMIMFTKETTAFGLKIVLSSALTGKKRKNSMQKTMNQ